MPQYPAPRLSNRLTAMAASLLCNLGLAAFIAVPDSSAFAAETHASMKSGVTLPNQALTSRATVVQLPRVVVYGKRSSAQGKVTQERPQPQQPA